MWQRMLIGVFRSNASFRSICASFRGHLRTIGFVLVIYIQANFRLVFTGEDLFPSAYHWLVAH
jgi:hypothetical protein